MTTFGMTIDGVETSGDGSFGVLNPATEDEAGHAPTCSGRQLDDAVASAKRAFRTWKRDESARRAALRNAAELVEANANDIARTLTIEQGKPLSHATAEVYGSAAQLKSIAAMPLPHEVTRDDDKARIEICYRPYGVVGGITPWNYPILIAMAKLAPALLAGNTMVLKPSPFTPLSTLALGKVLNQALPPGVLNVISGGGELGARLSSHPDVKKLSFTGSVPTGKKVGQAAAADLKRVTLELGGNDPAVILDDVNPEAIATQLFWSAFTNAGQICTAVKRVYAPEALFEPLVNALANIARQVKVGDGLDPDTQLGPINNAMQLQRVTELVDDARKRGAKIHAGGERLARKGYFYAPTIITGVADDVAIVAEEQFGPVLPVLSYRNLDEVLERANATNYGLGASVWSTDGARARAVAEELDAGTVWINQHLALTALAPFGGAKWSGVGEAGGRWGLASFLQKHVINQRIG
ncbi:MAG TPA: aldehyde dehydrogenase family protein [Polyangiaceae bacterium]|jgi:acyl-CoA reductase-like NAD-dependent aldehyde dehydrogenase|nr:aldehyde dehydrogenase family protein [Polyangiaceae bacterium]